MGEFFDWDAGKYGLDIPLIDDEHRQIIDAMNELHRLHSTGQPASRLAGALTQLQRVTVAHFKDEEAYMARIGYADLQKHRLVHEHLLKRLEDFARDFRSSGALTEDFFHFLKMWLKSHICGIDAQYAAHSRAA